MVKRAVPWQYGVVATHDDLALQWGQYHGIVSSHLFMDTGLKLVTPDLERTLGWHPAGRPWFYDTRTLQLVTRQLYVHRSWCFQNLMISCTIIIILYFQTETDGTLRRGFGGSAPPRN